MLASQLRFVLFLPVLALTILNDSILARDHPSYPIPPDKAYPYSWDKQGDPQILTKELILDKPFRRTLNKEIGLGFPRWTHLPENQRNPKAGDSYLYGNGQLSLVSRALLGYATAVYAEGNYAYVGAGGALVIFDVTDSFHPQIVGKIYLPNEVNSVYVQGDYAYVGHPWPSGLIVIDVSDKRDPSIMAHITEINGLSISAVNNLIAIDNYLYAAADEAGLVIFDIRDPTSPLVIGILKQYSGCNQCDVATDVAVSGDYAYVSYWDGWTDDAQWGFWVVDISDPYNPEGVGLWDPGHDVFNVEITEGYAIVDNYIVDVSNPEEPMPVAFVPGGMGESMIVDTLLYMSGGGLQIFNINDPLNIELLSEYIYPWYKEVWVFDGKAYMAGWYAGLGIFDVSNTDTIVYISNYPTGGFANGVAVSGNYAYVTDGWLRILDISDIENPVEISHFENPGYAVNVLVKDSLAYVSATYGGLRIVDVSDPLMPNEIGHYDTSDLYVNHAFVKDILIFIATSSQGLVILDASDMSSPKPISNDNTYYGLEVALKDSFAVLASNDSGLFVLDVSNPLSIEQMDHIKFYEPFAVPARSVCLKDSLIFVGLKPLIAPVPNVVILALDEYGKAYELLNWESRYFYNWTEHVRVVGNLIYASDYWVGFYILNFTDTNIEFLDGYQTNFYLWSSDVLEDYIFLAHDRGGLHVLRYDSISVEVDLDLTSLPSKLSLSQNYPNPFNASTILSYELPINGKVHLRIFDLLGKETQSLVNDYQDAGTYSLLWDASNYPSGIYFCQLKIGNYVKVKKMVLLR